MKRAELNLLEVWIFWKNVFSNRSYEDVQFIFGQRLQIVFGWPFEKPTYLVSKRTPFRSKFSVDTWSAFLTTATQKIPLQVWKIEMVHLFFLQLWSSERVTCGFVETTLNVLPQSAKCKNSFAEILTERDCRHAEISFDKGNRHV